MPLIEGKSKKVISQNIHEAHKAGYPLKQAIAMSLHNAGYKRKKKKGAKK